VSTPALNASGRAGGLWFYAINPLFLCRRAGVDAILVLKDSHVAGRHFFKQKPYNTILI
jgi:hypothetical protein